MKKIYFLLSVLTAFSVNAQLTQTNHAPANGDSYQMYQCDSVAPGASGANVLWNFSAINTHSSILTTYTAQSVSTSTYPAANIGLATSPNNTSFLASSANSLLYYGGNISTGGVSGSLTYTAPAVWGVYPMSLATSSTVATGGTISVSNPFPTTGSFTGNSNVVADGTGTINLPGGVTYTDVIRVVTSQTIFISAFTTATVNQMNYEYYSVSSKDPLFMISTSTVQITGAPAPTTQTIVSRNKDAATPTGSTTVGISEINAGAFNLSVYPNPSSTFVNFATDHQDAAQVLIYDVTGKMVDRQLFHEGRVKLDVSSYNKGLYLYTVLGANDNKLKSGKITVSH